MPSAKNTGLIGFAFAVVTAPFLLFGCTALHSVATSDSDQLADQPRVGNYYFLPRGVIQLDGAPVSKDIPAEFQVSIKTQNVPDKTRRYFLAHRTNVFYEDDLQIKVNGKGLLETTSLSTEDKTPAIISKITETLVDTAQIAAAGPLFRNAREVMASHPLKPFHVIFDPFDPSQRANAVAKLSDCGFDLKFPNPSTAIARMIDGKDKTSAKLISSASAAQLTQATDIPGVIYRPPTAIELEITTQDNSTAGLLQHVWVRLPSPTEIAIADASRAFLIKKKNNYSFVDGDLIQIDHNKPSQLLAFISVPADIAHQIAGAIPTIISIEDKRAARLPPDLVAQKAQLDAETAVLNSKIALLQAQQKLEQTQGTGPHALTREALQNQATAEEEEAAARLEKARTEKAEAQRRASNAQGQQQSASPVPEKHD